MGEATLSPEIKRPEHEADQSPSSSAYAKNTYLYVTIRYHDMQGAALPSVVIM
jgi:hypothetical protein